MSNEFDRNKLLKMAFPDQITYFEEHPEAIIPGAMNNWHGKLPGGYQRGMVETANLLDAPSVKLGRGEDLHSKILRSQTRREFFATIDKVMVNIGLAPTDIEEMVKGAYKMAGLIESGKLIKQIEGETIPAYLLLRKKGYTHYDLVQ